MVPDSGDNLSFEAHTKARSGTLAQEGERARLINHDFPAISEAGPPHSAGMSRIMGGERAAASMLNRGGERKEWQLLC